MRQIITVTVSMVVDNIKNKHMLEEKVDIENVPSRLKELQKEYPHAFYNLKGGGWMYQHK